MRVWTENVETAVRQQVEPDIIIQALDELKLAALFTAEASIDGIRSAARTMLYAATARKALWLK